LDEGRPKTRQCVWATPGQPAELGRGRTLKTTSTESLPAAGASRAVRRFSATHARRQCDAVDPDNRLVAGELERRWNEALQIVYRLEGEVAAIEARKSAPLSEKERRHLLQLGADLELAWSHPAGKSSRTLHTLSGIAGPLAASELVASARMSVMMIGPLTLAVIEALSPILECRRDLHQLAASGPETAVPRELILLPEASTPERCLEAYHLHRARLELIAERKVRRRQLTDDGNIEITGRDLRDRTALPFLENSLMPSSQITVVTPERWPHTSGSYCYG
jgi:hypothetical protein